jgi:hypothetical protein
VEVLTQICSLTVFGCGEQTGISNKLWVWVWHSPKPQKGANTIMPNNLQAWVGTASAVEVGKMQYSCFLLMFTFKEKLSQVLPVPKNCNVMPPPLRTSSPPHFATVYDKLTGGGGGWCVSIWESKLPGPSFVHVWSSVCCLFLHLPLSSVKVSRTSLGRMRDLASLEPHQILPFCTLLSQRFSFPPWTGSRKYLGETLKNGLLIPKKITIVLQKTIFNWES